MPPYAVLKRLGPSELSVGGNEDLATRFGSLTRF
jgi:hypothetical protein